MDNSLNPYAPTADVSQDPAFNHDMVRRYRVRAWIAMLLAIAWSGSGVLILQLARVGGGQWLDTTGVLLIGLLACGGIPMAYAARCYWTGKRLRAIALMTAVPLVFVLAVMIALNL